MQHLPHGATSSVSYQPALFPHPRCRSSQKRVAAPPARSGRCPQARQWEGMNGEPSARTKAMPEPRGHLSGGTCLSGQRAQPPFWGRGLAWNWYPGLFLHLQAAIPSFGRLLGLGKRGG